MKELVLLAASPCTRFSRAPSTISESDFHCGVCLPSDVPRAPHTPAVTAGDRSGSPRFLTLPFPSVPCAQTPPRSPATWPLVVAYLCLPEVRFRRPSVVVVTRLNRFTCVTAQMSLCLHLTHVVASMSPRLDSWWGGSSPCQGGNLTR